MSPLAGEGGEDTGLAFELLADDMGDLDRRWGRREGVSGTGNSTGNGIKGCVEEIMNRLF